MKKELHKRYKDNSLLFKCCCGGHHFVEFNYESEYENWIEYWVSVIDDGGGEGFFRRIKSAMKYIFKKDKLYWCEIGLNSRDLKRIKKHIDKYLEVLKK
jgi:hypothetical protein